MDTQPIRVSFAALVAFALSLSLYCPQCAPEHLGEDAKAHETGCQAPGEAPTHLPDAHDLTAVRAAAPSTPAPVLFQAPIAPALVGLAGYAPPVRLNHLPPPRPALLGLRTTILRC